MVADEIGALQNKAISVILLLHLQPKTRSFFMTVGLDYPINSNYSYCIS